MVSNNLKSSLALFRQTLTLWPLSAPTLSHPSTLSAPWSLPAATRPSISLTTAHLSPSLSTPHLSVTWSTNGASPTSWWLALSTVQAFSGPTPSLAPSLSCHSVSSCTTASLTCSSWPPSASCSPSPTADWLASGTMASDGASLRTSSEEASTTTPLNSRNRPFGAPLNRAETDLTVCTQSCCLRDREVFLYYLNNNV